MPTCLAISCTKTVRPCDLRENGRGSRTLYKGFQRGTPEYTLGGGGWKAF